MPDNDRDEDFVIADDGEIVMTDDAAVDIIDGHPELDAGDLTVDIEDDYGG